MNNQVIHSRTQLENMLDQILDKADKVAARAGNRLLSRSESDFIQYVEDNMPATVEQGGEGKITKAYELARKIF